MLTDLDYELLSAYIDGMLNESERTAFELRLQVEPELSRELDELRATVTLLNNLPARKAPRDFTLDARYTRRSSFFLTSAAFSAFSTAAAIILFAVGAYLFTSPKTPLASTAPQQQAGQVASVPTTTGATFDKAAALTDTPTLLQNEIATTSITFDSPILPPDAGVANDGIMQITQTMLPTSLAGESSLFQTDIVQATQTLGELGDTNSSAAAASSDMQQRTNEATETSANEQESATGGALPAPSIAQSTASTEAQAPSSMAFAATHLPLTATLTLSPTLTASSTLTSSPTLTLSPTLTSSPTLTPSATLTETATPQPTATPVPSVVQPPVTAPDTLPLLLLLLGGIFLVVAVVTTLIRRRNRS